MRPRLFAATAVTGLLLSVALAGPAGASYAEPSKAVPAARPAGQQQAIWIDFIGGQFCVMQRGGSNRSGTEWSQWDCFPAN